MNTYITSQGLEVTQAIQEYCEKKLEGAIRRHPQSDSATFQVEMVRTTEHHRKGDVYKVSIQTVIGNQKHYSEAISDDLYRAMDQAKDALERTVFETRNKYRTLFKRGAQKIKSLLKRI